MDAYILHIREEYAPETNWSIKNKYSAWCTEKQAYHELKKYLESDIVFGPFNRQQILRKTAIILLEVEKYAEALELVNGYSTAFQSEKGGDRSAKVTLSVTKSTFRGSVFE